MVPDGGRGADADGGRGGGRGADADGGRGGGLAGAICCEGGRGRPDDALHSLPGAFGHSLTLDPGALMRRRRASMSRTWTAGLVPCRASIIWYSCAKLPCGTREFEAMRKSLRMLSAYTCCPAPIIGMPPPIPMPPPTGTGTATGTGTRLIPERPPPKLGIIPDNPPKLGIIPDNPPKPPPKLGIIGLCITAGLWMTLGIGLCMTAGLCITTGLCMTSGLCTMSGLWTTRRRDP
jgi:hypothetical protein